MKFHVIDGLNSLQSEKAAIRRKKHWFLKGLVVLILWLAGVIIYQTHKPLPAGMSMEGPIHHVSDADIHFLYDLTHTSEGKMVPEQMIFDRIYKAIEEAEQFIVIDVFLYNDYHNKGQSFPPLSRTLTDKLIAQKAKYPNMRIVVNVDDINTLYGSHPAPELPWATTLPDVCKVPKK